MLKKVVGGMRGKALILGATAVLMGGGIAAAATEIAEANQEAAEEKAAAADAHAQAVEEAVATFTGLLDEWTSCVAANAASRGDTQSDPASRSVEPFDPKDDCPAMPVIELPDPPGDEVSTEVEDEDGPADGPPAEVEDFLAQLETWVGCVQAVAGAQSDEGTRDTSADFEAADQCDPKPTNPNDDPGAEGEENGEPPEDAGPPEEAGRPDDAGPPEDVGPPPGAGPDN